MQNCIGNEYVRHQDKSLTLTLSAFNIWRSVIFWWFFIGDVCAVTVTAPVPPKHRKVQTTLNLLRKQQDRHIIRTDGNVDTGAETNVMQLYICKMFSKDNDINTWNEAHLRWQQIMAPTIRSIQEIKTHFPDLLDGLGSFPGEDYYINIDAPSKTTLLKSVLVHQEKAVKEEIDKMLARGVIVPIHKSTSWINSFKVSQSSKTDGTIKSRVCLDPRHLKYAIIRESYYYQYQS